MIDSDELKRLEQAIAWRVRLVQSFGNAQEEFEAWLLADPRNDAAWYSVQIPWEILGDNATSPEVIGLRRTALAHANGAAPGWRTQAAGKLLRHAARIGLAAAAVALVAGSWVLWQSYHFEVYQTKAGEHRMETLSDGSEISLDSNSEVRVRYGRHSRELLLARGQALFSVAHDVLRPFSVAAGNHEIVATGTSFNVDMLGPQLMVTLLEGHVVVMPHARDQEDAAQSTPPGDLAGQTGSRIDLDAGEQLVLAPSEVPSVTRVNVDRAVAWEKGRLIFEDESLGSVVRRVGRYSPYPIVIEDDTTARLRISGVFHEGDVKGFVSTIEAYLPVHAEQQSDGSVHLSVAPVPRNP
jgi:transmembrane sensor